MGQSKPLLLWGNEPLVVRMAHVLNQGGAAHVVVVVSPGGRGEQIADVLRPYPFVTVAVNNEPQRGMLSSVQVGVNALQHVGYANRFLVSPCDLPLLDAQSVRAVVSATDNSGSFIAVPMWQNKRGHPALFAGLTNTVLALNPQDGGLNRLVDDPAQRIITVPATSDGVLRDADTPEDWQKLTDAHCRPTTNRI
jgi:molybdenum cofactor cytidylyltransferase